MVRFFAVSTSETVSGVFPNWVNDAFEDGQYYPFDLNMPQSIPRRTLEAYAVDSPITEHGIVLAKLSAHRLAHCGIKPTQIICGPELGNVQTATAILKTFAALGDQIRIGVEYGLCGWPALHANNTKELWISPAELKALEYDIDEAYESLVPHSALKESETHSQFANRLKKVIAEKSSSARPVIFVADASVLLVARGRSWNTPEELCKMKSAIRACTTHVAIEDKKDHGSLLPMTRTYLHSREQEQK